MPVYSAEGAPLFSEDSGGSLRLLAWLVLASVLMAIDLRIGLMRYVRELANNLVEPIHELATAPLALARAVRDRTAERAGLIAENARLRERLLFAQAKLDRLVEVQEQNNRLRALLEARHRLGLRAQLAELIDVDLDPFRHRILIDQGERDGVFPGEAVIDAQGLIGQVLDAEAERATVILLSDPSHAVPVRVQRNGLRAIAYGTGDPDRIELPHVPFSADLKVGDLLVTSGIGGRFPPGLPVATIYEVQVDDSATFAVAQARPMAGIGRSTEFLLVYDETLSLRSISQSETRSSGASMEPGVETRTEAPAP